MIEIPTIGDEIRRLRKEKGFTTRDLAARLGVTHVSVSKYESGQTHISEQILTKLAEVLEVDEPYLTFLNMNIPAVYKAVIVESGNAPQSLYHILGIPPRSSQAVELLKTLFTEIGEKKHVTFYQQFIERLKGYNLDPPSPQWIEYYRGILEFTKQNNEEGTKILTELYRNLTLDVDSDLFVTVAMKIAREHYVKNRLRESQEYYVTCQSLYEQQRNPRGISDVLCALAEVHEKEGNYHQSVHSLEKALALVADRPIEQQAQNLLRLGVVYRYGGRLHEALEHLRKSLSIWETLQNMPRVCNTQVALSDAYLDSYNAREATKWSRKAKTTLEGTKQQIDNAFYFNLQGFVECSEGASYLVSGRFRNAINVLETTRNKYEDILRIHNYRTIASHIISIALRHLTQAYYQAGSTRKAEELCHQTLSELESGYSSHTLIHRATILTTLGEIYLSQDKLEKINHITTQFQDLKLSQENPQHYPSLARFHLLEGKIAIYEHAWDSAAMKLGEAIKRSIKWNVVLLTHEIAPKVQSQIELLREGNPARTDELVNQIKGYCETYNLLRDDVPLDFLNT